MMNNCKLRRPYAAPTAELVCLAPNTPIATKGSWTWSGGSSNSKWNNSTNHWFGGNLTNAFLENASVTGIATWVDDEGVTPELD